MAGEAPSSEIHPSTVLQTEALAEATINSKAQGGAESSCNNNGVETSAVTSDGDREKSLEYAEELMQKGSSAAKESDYTEATECYSRALEIRVAHYGELAPECVNAYYKYGCALLYKAQQEADPLASMPKKEGESQQVSPRDVTFKNDITGESSIASAASNTEQNGSSKPREGATDDASKGKDQEEEDEGSDAEDLAEADEDESDLDLAWKMLDVARAIVEKHSGDTMEKVDILSALAEVALEREDIETSLGDYLKALAILEHLVEPDSRHLAELNFRICLCLEIGSKAQEAIPYCQKAISICKSRVQRLVNELNSLPESSTTPVLDQAVSSTSSVLDSKSSNSDTEAEIEILNGLSVELEKKLEDLQQLVTNPTSILSDILGMVSAKAKSIEKNSPASVMSSSQMGVASSSSALESPTVSTAHTNGASGVTHLGVVGRGVKRVNMSSSAAESTPAKKPALDKSEGKSS